MNIQTDRLIIRPFKKDDYKRIYEVCSDFDVAKMTLSMPIPYYEENAKGFIDYTLQAIKEKTSYECAICYKENPDRVIGCIGVMHIDSTAKRAELGWWVDKAEWNKGIATEAAKAVINYCFESLKLHTVFARCFEINPASGKVMQKCGMTYVGKMRDFECRLGEYKNVLYYDLVDKDYGYDNKE